MLNRILILALGLFIVACSDMGEPEILNSQAVFESTQLDFGLVTVGSAQTRSFTIANVGEADLIGELSLGAGSGGFLIEDVSTFTIQPGTQISVNVHFTPSTESIFQDTIWVDSNDPVLGIQPIIVTGTGTAAPVPALTASASSYDFGAVLVGASSNETLSLSSIGTDTVVINSVVSGSLVFSINNLTLPISLIPGASVDLELEFSPDAVGDFSSTISITSNAPDSPLQIGVTGSGLPLVSFASDVQPVLSSNCGSCHGGSGGLTVTSYASLMAGNSNNGPVISPGDGTNSVLVRRLRAQGGSLMPQGGPALSATTIQSISDWIDQGALNN